MKGKSRSKRQERLARQSQEEAAEYWGNHDSSWLFDGEPVRMQVELAGTKCAGCGGARLTRHRADLPALGGRLVLAGVDLLRCLDCGRWAIAEEARRSADSLVDEVRGSDGAAILDGALADWVERGERVKRRRNDRRIVTFYFPGRTNGPHAAKLSVRTGDPLLGILRSKGSAEVRKLLGIDSYEDLEGAARVARRPVSQFLRTALEEKLLGRRRGCRERVGRG